MSVIFFEIPPKSPPRAPASKIPLSADEFRDLREGSFWKDCVSLAQETLRACIPAGKRYVPADLRELNAVNHPPGLVPAGVLRETILEHLANQQDSGETPDFPLGGKSADAHRVSTEDTECQLTQLCCRYVRATGDKDILMEQVSGQRVLDRILASMEYLWKERWEPRYGLIINRPLGNKPSIGLHINSSACIAIRELLELPGINSEQRRAWVGRIVNLGMAVRTHLWDKENKRHYPRRISPEGLIAVEESCIHPYASALAMQAGFLNDEEKAQSLADLLTALEVTGGLTPGFSHLPPGPDSPDDLFSHPYMPLEWSTTASQIAAAYGQAGFASQALQMLRAIGNLSLSHNLFAEIYTATGPQSSTPSPSASAAFLHAHSVLSPALEALPRTPLLPAKALRVALPIPPATKTLKKNAPDENRLENRRTMELPVLVRVKGGGFQPIRFAAIVRNGSPGGMGVELPRPLAEGVAVEIRLFLHDSGKDHECRLWGRVVWCKTQQKNGFYSAGIDLLPKGRDFNHWTKLVGR